MVSMSFDTYHICFHHIWIVSFITDSWKICCCSFWRKYRLAYDKVCDSNKMSGLAHFSGHVCQFPNKLFPNRWFYRGGPFSWPTLSPDLNPLDFFFWSHVKVWSTKHLRRVGAVFTIVFQIAQNLINYYFKVFRNSFVHISLFIKIKQMQ